MQSRFESVLYLEDGSEGSINIFPFKDRLDISEIFETPVSGKERL